MSLLLAVDVGNSNTVFGVFSEGQLHHTWRLSTDPARTADEYTAFLSSIARKFSYAFTAGKAIISSVTPRINRPLASCLREQFGLECTFVPEINHPILINGSGAGSDLIVNAMAALTIYKEDCIIVDFGTATTFSSVRHATKEIIGVVIAPGILSSMKALTTSAAQLHDVALQQPSGSILCLTTENAIGAGVYYGFLDLAAGIIGRIKSEKKLGADCRVVATGGTTKLFRKEDAPFFDTIEPDFTLFGLYELAKYNTKQRV